MSTVKLIGPDGKQYDFDASAPGANLEQAKAAGFRVADDIGLVESAVDTFKAAGLHAAQGLTGGLLGAAAGAEQGVEESPEDFRARHEVATELTRLREESPVASVAGELAGAVFSPINKVGAAVKGARAISTVGRIAQEAKAGAAVGSLFGAGNALSEAALGDTQLTAENLAASVGLGALLGGAGGALGSAVEEGAAAVLPKAGRALSEAQKMLDDVANDAAVRATRAQQSVINRIGEAKLTEAGRVLREGGHLKALGTADDMLKSLEKDIAATGKTKGGFLDAADAAGSRPDFAAALKSVDDWAARLSPLERDTVKGELAKARTALEDIATDPKAGTWRAFDKWKQDVQAKAKFSRGQLSAEDDLALGLRRQLAGVAREELDRQLVPALGADGARFLETKSTYAALKDAERLAQSGAGRPGGFGYIGLKDLLAGGAGAVVHPAGFAGALASKFMREHGQALVAKTADAVSKSPALVAIAESMGKALPTLAPQLGQYAAPLAAAFGTSPAVGLATHMAMSQVDPGYSATAQLAGLSHEEPEHHGAALGRAHGLAEVAATARQADVDIDKGIAAVLRGEKPAPAVGKVMGRQDFGAKRMRRGELDAHAKRVEEIRHMATDPMALVERVAANMGKVGTVAPGVAAALTAQADRAVKYLADAAREPPKKGPLAADWVPSEAQRFEFAQKLQVVERPMSVLQHAAAGTLTSAQVDALRAVYPRLYATISQKALEQALGAKSVPYRSRLMLSMLTGMDLDGTTSQEALARNQEAIRGTKQGEDAAPADQGSRSEMTLGQRMALPNQRRDSEAP